MGPLKEAKASIELAVGKVTKPLGFVRHVQVSVGKYTFSVDFYVSDYEPDPRVPIIFGRPFFAATCAHLDFDSGKMELGVREAFIYFLTSYAYEESDDEEDEVWELNKELERMTKINT